MYIDFDQTELLVRAVCWIKCKLEQRWDQHKNNTYKFSEDANLSLSKELWNNLSYNIEDFADL